MSTDTEANPSSETSPVALSAGARGYREYSYRFVIMALYFGVSITNQMLWVTCSPITTNLQNIYDISQIVVNMSGLISMLVYVPAAIPGNYLLDTYGTKIGLIVGTVLTVLGAWIRMLAGFSFYYVLLGQLISALGQPLIMNCPQKISAFWTTPKKRTIFTTILTLSAPMGVALGFLLPGSIVGSENDPTNGEALFLQLILIEAIISTVLCAPLLIFFREKPPTPPSASAELPRDSFKKGMKSIIKNKNFLLLLVIEGAGLGALNTMATVIQSIVDPFNFSQFDSSVLGVIIIVFGVIGSIFMGLYVEKTRKYKRAITVCIFVGGASFGILIGVLFSQNMIALSVTTAILGFFITPILPLGLEFACEITFPVGEAVSGGAMIGMSQIVGAAQIFIINAIMLATGNSEQNGPIISLAILIGFMVAAFMCAAVMKETLLRSKHDQYFHKSKKVQPTCELENLSNGRQSARSQPFETQSVEKQPVEIRSAENQLFENKLVENHAENQAVENQPAENQPAENRDVENQLIPVISA